MRRKMFFVFALVFVCMASLAGAQSPGLTAAALLSVDKVDALAFGTPVYGYSTLDPGGPKRFEARLLGVMSNTIGPGHQWIAVELNQKTSPVIAGGQSGSPMFIDVRGVPHKIGTLSYGEYWARNPIAYLTPIQEVLNTDHANSAVTLTTPKAMSMARVLWDLLPAGDPMRTMMSERDADGVVRMAENVSSGIAVSGKAGPVRPGAVLGVQLAWGDFDYTSWGTVSHISGDQVFMFGHPFAQLGPVEYRLVPMKVLTVQQRFDRSFILAAPIQGAAPVGVITQDRETAIYGTLGKEPENPIPVNISMTTSGGTKKEFNFFVTANPTIAPRLIGAGVATAINAWSRQLGDMTLFVNGKMTVDGVGDIEFSDSFTDIGGAFKLLTQKTGSILENRYSKAKINKVAVTVKVFDEYRKFSIDSASLDQPNFRPGDTINLKVTLSQPLRDPKTITLQVPLPADLRYGVGKIIVGDHGAIDAIEREGGNVVNLAGLVESLNQKRRPDAVYVYIVLPPSQVGPPSSEEPVPLRVGDIMAEVKRTSKRLSSNVEEYQVVVGDFQVDGRKEVGFTVGTTIAGEKPPGHP